MIDDRRHLPLLLSVLAVLALTGLTAEAQVCAGAPSFASGPTQVNVMGEFTSDAQTFGGGVGFGAPRDSGPLGFVSVGVTNVSDLDATATTFSGTFVYELAADQARRVFVCPGVGIGYSSGPDVDDVDISIFQWTAGAQVGVLATESGSVGVVPTFGLRIARARVTAKFLGVDESVSETFGIANIGVGLIFNKNMALTPAVAIPFSLEGGDAIFVVSFSVNFGR